MPPRPYPPRGLMLVAALVAGALACQSQEAEIAGLLDQGREFIEAGEPGAAAVAYHSALRLDPNRADIHYALAGAYETMGELGKAYFELHETVRLDPSDSEARLRLANLAVLDLEYDVALANAEAVLAARPGELRAHLVQAIALERLGRMSEAEAAFESALEAAPDAPLALKGLGAFLSRRERYAEAEPLLERAAEREPAFASQLLLAEMRMAVPGREVETEAALRQALALAAPEEQARAHAILVNFLLLRGRTEAARTTLEHALETLPDRTQRLPLVALLAELEHALGHPALALEILNAEILADPTGAEPLLIKSSHLERAGDLDAALAAALAASETNPGSTAAELRSAELLGVVGYRERDARSQAQAREMVARVLAREPTLPLALLVRARMELLADDAPAAERSARLVAEARPESAAARHLLGASLAAQGRQQHARVELLAALRLDSGLVAARRLLVELDAELGYHDETVDEGRQHLRLHPDDSHVRALVMQSLVRSGRTAEALAELEAVPEARRDLQLRYALAHVYLSRGEADAARALLLEAARERPGHEDVLRTLHAAELALGQAPRSRARINAAVETRPEDPRLRVLLGIALRDTGDLGGAERELRLATELDPGDAEAIGLLAGIYLATGRPGLAREAYERGIETLPDHARLHLGLGSLVADDDPGRAIEHFERAVASDPRLAEAKNNLAFLLAETASGPEDPRLEMAQRLAEEATTLMDGRPVARDTLGWVLLRRGQTRAATLQLEVAVAEATDDDPARGLYRLHLARAYEADARVAEAVATLQRALAAHHRRTVTIEVGGQRASEPAWTVEAREALRRLKRTDG